MLDFDRDKANVKRRFFEAFPLTEHLLGNAEVVARLQALVDDAQDVRFALVTALTSAHDARKHGGLALADAESAFWTASEPSFLDWLSAVTSIETWTDESDALVDAARARMASALRRTAASLFDAHVELSEFDLRKQKQIASARRSLLKSLYPRVDAPEGAPKPAASAEVKP